MVNLFLLETLSLTAVDRLDRLCAPCYGTFLALNTHRSYELKMQKSVTANRVRTPRATDRFEFLTMVLLLNFDQWEADYTDSVACWCTITLTINTTRDRAIVVVVLYRMSHFNKTDPISPKKFEIKRIELYKSMMGSPKRQKFLPCFSRRGQDPGHMPIDNTNNATDCRKGNSFFEMAKDYGLIAASELEMSVVNHVMQDTTDPAIEIQDLCYSYGFAQWKVGVLKGVSLTVPAGSIYGLLGPSGCGKTTLLRCVVGTLKPASGLIKLFGHVPGTRASKVPGSGVGYMPQRSFRPNGIGRGVLCPVRRSVPSAEIQLHLKDIRCIQELKHFHVSVVSLVSFPEMCHHFRKRLDLCQETRMHARFSVS
uniref:ABC transporter domain-containing protein n=1 Tax=Strigamia maritima TaxID=126957 RepID=T1JM33_STRMM